MILAFSPSLRRDVDLTRLSADELSALRRDMDSPAGGTPRRGSRGLLRRRSRLL